VFAAHSAYVVAPELGGGYGRGSQQVVKMAPIPPLTPPPPESTGARVPARKRSEVSDETIRQSNASLIFVKLRKMIASDTQNTDTILGAIAVAAHSLTGATGAAVAMPRDGAVVCVGRSGETAPELGARLNLDSGISGECLRTGVIMRCDDASRNFHVDAEVCRQLGLLSIAVVPLRGQQGRVGVLEAFSTESYAFTEDKMEVLGRLAGLAEAAWARSAVTEVPPVEVLPVEAEGVVTASLTPVVEAPAELPRPIAPTVPLAQMREIFATEQPEVSIAPRKWLYAILAAVVLLAVALLSVYGWRAWYRSSVASKTSQPAAVSAAASGGSENAAAGSGLASTADIVRPSSRPSSRAGGLTALPAAKTGTAVGAPDDVVRRPPQSAGPAHRGEAKRGVQPSAVSNSEEIPQLAASSANPADLGKALATAPALPQLGVPVSQGIGGGVLVHRVQPVYPAEARRMRVQGSVVIDAIVTEQGQVDELKLVSGDSMLAEAAMDAVRRWRYTPYSLNGKPISKPTRITISFIAPQ
jgi:TonB family protein